MFGILFVALLLLGYLVLDDLLKPLAWAGILAYVTWPIYRWILRLLDNRAGASAFLMTLILIVAVVLPVAGIAASLREELKSVYEGMAAYFSDGQLLLPDFIARIPWLGPRLQQFVNQLVVEPAPLGSQVAEWLRQSANEIAKILAGIGSNLLKLGVALLTVFFLYRDGHHLIDQIRQGLQRIVGEKSELYLQALASTTLGVIYGLVLTALAQGILAGLGYWAAGIGAPVLLGVLTALFALVPYGAPAVWGSLSIWLLWTGQWWAGIGLLLWGTLIVSTVDNFIRPLLISSAAQVHFLLVALGVIGGLQAFGVVGLFVGPVILSIWITIWKEWLAEKTESAPDGAQGKEANAESRALPGIASERAVHPSAWHALIPEAVVKKLATDPQHGLSSLEAAERLARYGPNRLVDKPPRSAFRVFFDQFKSLLILILIIAAGLAGAIGDLQDALVIFAVVLINGLLGFYQEYRAEQSLAAVKKMLTPEAEVRRDGRRQIVPAVELVPGDIVLLDAGDRVPADGRVLAAHGFEIDESSLTGESHPVGKQNGVLERADVPLAERCNMLYMNTTVTRGRAEMAVTATGMETEIGRLAEMLSGGDEPTPLQIQLDNLGKRLAVLAGLVVAIIFISALLRDEPLMQTIMTAISLAVAAVPEGLPAVVTVTLALGLRRMAKQRAIVKRLAAVETLGCTTVICSDKTGTLTLNQMTARALFFRGGSLTVSGEGYDTAGTIRSESEANPTDLEPLLLPLALCNDSHLRAGQIVGDPMEGALLVLAAKGELDRDAWAERLPQVAEIPFDAGHKFMATFHRDGARIRIFVKGAPDVMLARCIRWLDRNGEKALDQVARRELIRANEAMAASGLRVLGAAMGALPAARFDPGQDLFAYVEGLTFTGLVGLMDPPRREAQEAIALCQKAGIQVKMITGDQKMTAGAIARELGIEGAVLGADEMAALDDEALAGRIESVAVFARVAPEQKVRIVRTLKARGHVVAMTGDGVNDAPALKRADIGIAMGIAGTDVAKEAAAMVLTDDNFSTIVRAVKEGRTIYDNIVKFVRFQLSTNIGAILSVFSAPLLGLPLPFNPIQILWVNIIMDGPPAMALGVDRPRSDVMEKPPRTPRATILTLRHLGNLAAYGFTMAAGTLGVLYYGLQSGFREQALTLAYTTFVLFQFFNAFNARAYRRFAFNAQFFSNWQLWLALGGVLGLQFLTVYWPPAQAIFHTTALAISDWGIAFAVASSVLILEELRKWLQWLWRWLMGFKRKSAYATPTRG